MCIKYPLVFSLLAILLTACGGGADSDTGANTAATSGGSTPTTPADTTAPSVAISGPTSASSYSTSSATIALSGSASDNVGVTQVTWSNNRGGSGTASGTTSWNTGNISLQSGSNVIAVTARDAAGNTRSDTLTVTYSTTTPGDTTAPSVTISSPTSGSTYTTSSGTLSLGGSASDNVSVTQVSWSNSRGGSGTASGTTSWSVGSITLQSGSNVITVTARDAANNQNTDVVTVTYNAPDTTSPAVTISSPTTGTSYTASSATLSLGGTASDNVGVTQVTWSNSLGGSGTASGTTSWSVSGIALQNGTNTLTVTARDAAGNTSSDILSVTYTTTSTSDDCASSTVLCVDDTAGATREFTTIQNAADAALPGDTILVHDGNYAGFQVSRSGTQASPIVFRTNGSGAVINSNGPTGDGIRLQDVSYVTIDGFRIQGVSQRCIAARGATADSPMRTNTVRNNTCTNAGTECIYVSQFSGSLIENNVLNGCGISGASKSHGIYLANAGSDNTTIRGNTISNATPSESEGIHINGDLSIGGDGIVSGLTIENNIIHSMAVNGLSMDGVQNSLIRNNLFYGNGRHAVRGYRGDAAAGPANLRFANNTFNGTGGWAIKLSEDLGGHTFFNNILLGSSGSICVGSSNLTSNNNAVTGSFSLDNESSIASLASWLASTGDDANSFVATSSILFINAATGNYRLSNTSPAINTGRSSLNGISAPTTDLSGAARPQGAAYDVGAYESSL
jgi:hypothetical protein